MISAGKITDLSISLYGNINDNEKLIANAFELRENSIKYRKKGMPLNIHFMMQRVLIFRDNILIASVSSKIMKKSA